MEAYDVMKKRLLEQQWSYFKLQDELDKALRNNFLIEKLKNKTIKKNEELKSKLESVENYIQENS